MDLSAVGAPAEAKCYLHMLAPELRRLVFNYASRDAFFNDDHPTPVVIHYPNTVYNLNRLLDPSLKPTDNDVEWGLTKLEAVLLQSHNDLYLECLHVRLSLTTLTLDSYKGMCPWIHTWSTRLFPIFGTDLPISLIQSVKEVHYDSPVYVPDVAWINYR
jgi:hypothetical protein